jgi:hypothetical protein
LMLVFASSTSPGALTMASSDAPLMDGLLVRMHFILSILLRLSDFRMCTEWARFTSRAGAV